MAQHDFGTIDPAVVGGSALAIFLNDWRDALHTLHRGATQPAYSQPGMMWIDDSGGPTNWILKIFIGGTANISLFILNSVSGSVALGSGLLPALGSMALQNSNLVAITGGSIVGITPLALANGGTGASTAPAARSGLGLGSLALSSAVLGALATLSTIDYTYINGGRPGVINDFAGASIPAGALLCDGALYSRSTYSRLFSAIGTVWGPGDGSTTFNVPDLQDRMTIGKGGIRVTSASGISGATLGAVGGDERAQAHQHDVANQFQFGFDIGSGAAYLSATLTPGGLTGVALAGNSQNMPPFAVVNKIIWY